MLPEIEFKVANQGNNPETYRACEEFIKKWQKILRIQDWEIDLKFLTGLEMQKTMGSENYNACCDRTSENKFATISLNLESPEINDNPERLLIHEMLHIVFDDYDTFTINAVSDNEYAKNVVKFKLEQTIESLAKSFSNLAKGDKSNVEEVATQVNITPKHLLSLA